MNFKKFFYLFIFISQISISQTVIGKYAGEFLSIGIGGRALGMGGAYVAVANDITGTYWNPAALGLLNYPEISLMHDEKFAGLVNYDYGAVVFPTTSNFKLSNAIEDSAKINNVVNNSATYGISFIRLGIDGIPDTRLAWNDKNNDGLFNDGGEVRPDISKITFFNAANYALYFSYAEKYNDELYFGGNIKLIRHDIGEFYANGIGVDLAAIYIPSNNLRFGAILQDVTSTFISWSTGRNELIIPTFKSGLAYIIPLYDGILTTAIDADMKFENRRYASLVHLGSLSGDIHAGIEYDYKNLVAIRAGYNELGNITLGAGLHLPKLDVDYSFAKFDAAEQLGNSHRISLRLKLEEEIYKR